MLTKSHFIFLYRENVQGEYISQHLGTKVRAIDGVLAKGMWAEVKSAAPEQPPLQSSRLLPRGNGEAFIERKELRLEAARIPRGGEKEERRPGEPLNPCQICRARNKPPLCEATERWGVSCYLSIA